jgi:hypothetical protein
MPAEPVALVRCHVGHLEARCRERGYTLADVAACIVQRDGDQLLVDTSHEAYPRDYAPGFTPRPSSGPGTELKKLLGRIGITASPTCSCNARARQMDALGCEWCEQNTDTITGWLREEAAKRRLPFLDAVGKLLVRRAISNARKEERRAQAQGGQAAV